MFYSPRELPSLILWLVISGRNDILTLTDLYNAGEHNLFAFNLIAHATTFTL